MSDAEGPVNLGEQRRRRRPADSEEPWVGAVFGNLDPVGQLRFHAWVLKRAATKLRHHQRWGRAAVFYANVEAYAHAIAVLLQEDDPRRSALWWGLSQRAELLSRRCIERTEARAGEAGWKGEPE